MKEFNESEIKYLAGLLDADGCLNLTHKNGYLGLALSLELSESCDRDGKYIRSLVSKVGNLYTRKREETWSQTNTWRVCARNSLEMLLPRLIKHMVIKAKHWQTLLNIFRESKGVILTNEEFLKLQTISFESRKHSGPIHEKIHPTWAWVAGYIEGDGWFLIRNRKYQTEIQVGIVAHPDDSYGIELLHKAFGGIVKIDSKGYLRWLRNLGPRDKAFAVDFCKKLVQHSQLKKHKIEQILSHHSQRLNEIIPTGNVIV